jgi:hypothetical protein
LYGWTRHIVYRLRHIVVGRQVVLNLMYFIISQELERDSDETADTLKIKLGGGMYLQTIRSRTRLTCELTLLNEAFFYDSTGKRRGTYVKKNLWHPERYVSTCHLKGDWTHGRDYLNPGHKHYPVFDTPGGKPHVTTESMMSGKTGSEGQASHSPVNLRSSNIKQDIWITSPEHSIQLLVKTSKQIAHYYNPSKPSNPSRPILNSSIPPSPLSLFIVSITPQ